MRFYTNKDGGYQSCLNHHYFLFLDLCVFNAAFNSFRYYKLYLKYSKSTSVEGGVTGVISGTGLYGLITKKKDGVSSFWT